MPHSIKTPAKLTIHDGRGQSLSGCPYDSLAAMSHVIKFRAVETVGRPSFEITIDTGYFSTMRMVLSWLHEVHQLVKGEPRCRLEVTDDLPAGVPVVVKLEILSLIDAPNLCDALKHQRVLRTDLYDIAKGRTTVHVTADVIKHMADTMRVTEPAMIDVACNTFVARADVIYFAINDFLTDFDTHIDLCSKIEPLLCSKHDRLIAARQARSKVRIERAKKELADHRIAWRGGGYSWQEGLRIERVLMRKVE